MVLRKHLGRSASVKEKTWQAQESQASWFFSSAKRAVQALYEKKVLLSKRMKTMQYANLRHRFKD